MDTVKLPQLKVILSSPRHEHYRHIVLADDSLCFIEDMDAFYTSLGYTPEMAINGLLPDEFVWEEYVDNSGYSICLQKHILDYLHVHSQKFNDMYGVQYGELVEEHAVALKVRGTVCAGCKLSEYCKDVVGSS